MIISLNNGPQPEPPLTHVSGEILLCASSVQPVYLACQHGGLPSEVRQVRTVHDRLSCMDGDSKTSVMLDLAQRENKWVHMTISTSIHNLVMVITSMLLCIALSHSPHNVVHSTSTVDPHLSGP